MLSPAVMQCWKNTRAVPANAIPQEIRSILSGDEKTGMRKYPSAIFSDCLLGFADIVCSAELFLNL